MVANLFPLQEHYLSGLYQGAPSMERLGDGALAVEAAFALKGRAPLALYLVINTGYDSVIRLEL